MASGRSGPGPREGTAAGVAPQGVHPDQGDGLTGDRRRQVDTVHSEIHSCPVSVTAELVRVLSQVLWSPPVAVVAVVSEAIVLLAARVVPDITAHVEKILALQPLARMTRLVEMLRQEPGYTVAAVNALGWRRIGQAQVYLRTGAVRRAAKGAAVDLTYSERILLGTLILAGRRGAHHHELYAMLGSSGTNSQRLRKHFTAIRRKLGLREGDIRADKAAKAYSLSILVAAGDESAV